MSDANITQSFIEMVKAYEAKPELERTIKALNEDRDYFIRHYEYERSISESLRMTITALENELKEARQERDDAMFRNLELEELKDKIGTLAGQLLGTLKVPVAESTQPVTQEPQALSMYTPEPIPETASWASEQPQPEPSTGEPSGAEPSPEPQPEPTYIYADVGLAPSLSPTHPDGWECGKPYSHKPRYMSDLEWYDRGGLIKPADDEILF